MKTILETTGSELIQNIWRSCEFYLNFDHAQSDLGVWIIPPQSSYPEDRLNPKGLFIALRSVFHGSFMLSIAA
jgi:hypothetical protein